MSRWFLGLSLVVIGGVGGTLTSATEAKERTSVERGRDAVVAWKLNPGIWSVNAYDNIWKVWGLKEKPANFTQLFRERYGLHAAPYDNHGRPMGLSEVSGLRGKGLVNSCLLCHAGTVAGQTIIGLGNSALELQGLFEELSQADGVRLSMPFGPMSYVRGTIDPVNPLTFLLEFRDPDLNVRSRVELGYTKDVCSDPPAWWLIKKKRTRDWTGGVDARSTRVDMVNLLTPLNTGGYIKKQEKVFADIEAFVRSIEAPKYPFAIDKALAEHGHGVFVKHCAKCHGTYGPDGNYPNKIVPLEELGTDPTLARAVNQPHLVAFLNKSWLGQEVGPDGELLQLAQNDGYQAPPLDGIWATANYFHNASVPTVYHVLNSKARPKIFTRTYRTGVEDYDPVKLGWKITELDKPAAASLPAIERRKIYDTTLPGRSNAGHRFGDKLTEEERMAVIEYLKTL
jgi:processive rubber oxygenase RoxA-like protein